MLAELKEKISEKDIISFDIFNTLLIRTVKKPKDIFVLLGKKQEESKVIKESLTAGEFAAIREWAERLVYKEKLKNINLDPEYTIFDIYEKFPDFLDISLKEIVKLEIEAEKENCYRDDVMYEILKECKKIGKRVILISDMYLPKQIIIELLEHIGINIQKYIDEIYVSCEYGINKRSGKLYHKVCEMENKRPEKFLHIGDDSIADVLGAKKARIESWHYRILEDIPISLLYEETYKENLVPELYGMRLLANFERMEKKREEFGYELGALFFGPVLSEFIEWLIEEAKKRNCKVIYPIMREGELFAKLLEHSLAIHKIEDIKVELLFLSRKVVFLPSYEEFSREMYEDCLEKPEYSIQDMFTSLGIVDEENIFKKYKDVFVKDINKIGEIDLKEELYHYLSKEDVKKKIDKEIKYQTKLISEYLTDKFGCNNNVITCDIGYRGTIQAGINHIIKKYNKNMSLTHCLLLGEEDAKKNYFNEVNIKGFLGALGDNIGQIKEWTRYAYLFEGFFMTEKGSTNGYKIKDGKIAPILKENLVSNRELEERKAFHDGVLAFQTIYLNIKKQLKDRNDKLPSMKKTELLDILVRILKMPTLKEAEELLKVEFDQNDGSSYIWNFYKKEYLEQCYQQGEELFLLENKKIENKSAYWPVGIVTLYNPSYFIKKEVSKGRHGYFELAMILCEKLKKDTIKEVLIYGAGDVGKDVIKALNIYQIHPIFFIDRNQLLWENKVEGVVVQSLEYVKKHMIKKPIIIASMRYIEEIKENIIEHLNIDTFYTL